MAELQNQISNIENRKKNPVDDGNRQFPFDRGYGNRTL